MSAGDPGIIQQLQNIKNRTTTLGPCCRPNWMESAASGTCPRGQGQGKQKACPSPGQKMVSHFKRKRNKIRAPQKNSTCADIFVDCKACVWHARKRIHYVIVLLLKLLAYCALLIVEKHKVPIIVKRPEGTRVYNLFIHTYANIDSYYIKICTFKKHIFRVYICISLNESIPSAIVHPEGFVLILAWLCPYLIHALIASNHSSENRKEKNGEISHCKNVIILLSFAGICCDIFKYCEVKSKRWKSKNCK